jgi:hypothetical protein
MSALFRSIRMTDNVLQKQGGSAVRMRVRSRHTHLGCPAKCTADLETPVSC